MKNQQDKPYTQRRIASKEEWETMNQHIHTLQSMTEDMENDSILLAALPDGDMPARRKQFDAYIHNANVFIAKNNAASLLQQWSNPVHQHHWLKNLNAAWQMAVQSMQLTGQSFQQASIPIQLMMQELSYHLTPAPAIRDAQLLQEKVYALKRRGIEATALPVFNPLFCTAVSPTNQFVKLHGLQPQSQYRLTMRGIAHSDWLHETTLLTSEAGVCELDIETVLHNYEECNPEHTRTAWFLRKLNSQHKSDWTSGVIWLDDQTVSGVSAMNANQDSSWRGALHQEYVTLIEINMLLARGFYVQAYEQARHALIFARKHQLAPDSLYMASLWQFCRQAVNEMIQTLKDAAPVFLQIDPAWNAVDSLEDLLTLMTPRT